MAEKASLAAFLSKNSRLGLDTSVFIYFVQEHSSYHSLCVPLFEAIENGKIEASASTLSLLEVLVQPYRVKREDLVLRFYALLTTYPHLRWIDLSKDIADTSARMRAEYRLRTPDAIQAATAVCSGRHRLHLQRCDVQKGQGDRLPPSRRSPEGQVSLSRAEPDWPALAERAIMNMPTKP